MKSKSDLSSIIPDVVKMLNANRHEIGELDSPAINCIRFEEDGWDIEVVYSCCGESDVDPGDYMTPSVYYNCRAWGEVTEITAFHCDEETNEETVFTESDLNELWMALDETLKDIV